MSTDTDGFGNPEAFLWPPPELIAGDFQAWLQAVLQEPGLFKQFALELTGIAAEAVTQALQSGQPGPAGRRYRHPQWQKDPALRLAGLLHTELFAHFNACLERTPGLPASQAKRLKFWLRQLAAAFHPANAIGLNPAVHAEMQRSAGQSVVRGMSHLRDDLAKNPYRLEISRQPAAAFEVGRDLASAAKVQVHSNALMTLYHYKATAPLNGLPPLLIVPPCINRYYILDLSPSNSFASWCTNQGRDVFLIDWQPASQTKPNWSLDDYICHGIDEAVAAITRQTGHQFYDLIGYCIGGTMSACHSAWRAARGLALPRKLTLLTTLLDFSEPGELGVFISKPQIAALDAHLQQCGTLSGGLLRQAFELLRPEELIWQAALVRYGLGREAAPNDMLFWSEDNPDLPGRMIISYLRQFYLDNKLISAGAVQIAGEGLDLSQISSGIMMVAASKDHIVPWQGALKSCAHLPGKGQFILADGGHISGIISPPGQKNAGYRQGSWPLQQGRQPSDWTSSAMRHHGSWWPCWADWSAK